LQTALISWSKKLFFGLSFQCIFKKKNFKGGGITQDISGFSNTKVGILKDLGLS
jgi:hypothetical protein